MNALGRWLLLGVVLAGLALLAPAHAAARPAPPAPERPPGAPPRAWIETGRAERWLAYSSYCWFSTSTSGLCADYIDPGRRNDLPRIAVRRGELVHIYLAFVPTESYVTIANRLVSVERSRVIDLRVRAGGVLVVHVYARNGDASWVARLVLRHASR
jgi:hypothetical protein